VQALNDFASLLVFGLHFVRPASSFYIFSFGFSLGTVAGFNVFGDRESLSLF